MMWFGHVRDNRSCQILSVNGACPSLVICAVSTPVKTTPELSRPAFGVLPKTGVEALEDGGKPGWERLRMICARSTLAWRRQDGALWIDLHGVYSWMRLRPRDTLQRESERERARERERERDSPFLHLKTSQYWHHCGRFLQYCQHDVGYNALQEQTTVCPQTVLQLWSAIVKCDYFKLSSFTAVKQHFHIFELSEIYFISATVHKVRTSQLYCTCDARPCKFSSNVCG